MIVRLWCRFFHKILNSWCENIALILMCIFETNQKQMCCCHVIHAYSKCGLLSKMVFHFVISIIFWYIIQLVMCNIVVCGVQQQHNDFLFERIFDLHFPRETLSNFNFEWIFEYTQRNRRDDRWISQENVISLCLSITMRWISANINFESGRIFMRSGIGFDCGFENTLKSPCNFLALFFSLSRFLLISFPFLWI